MKYLFHTITAWQALALGGIAVGQSGPPQSVLDQLHYLKSVDEMVARNGDATPVEIAQGYLTEAERRLRDGLPWTDILFNNAGMAYLAAGEPAEAVAVFNRIEQSAKSAMSRRYGAYKAGEILLLDLHRDREAADAFERYRLAVLADDGVNQEMQGGGLFATAVLYEASAERSINNRQRAIELRSTLLERPGVAALSDENLAMVCVENGRDAFALGDIQAGRAWYDRLFDHRPQFGWDDGRVVLFRVERALAGWDGRRQMDDSLIRELKAVWNDSDLAMMPEIMLAAHKLEHAYGKWRQYDNLTQICAEAWDRFNQHEQEWQDSYSPERYNRSVALFQTVATRYVSALRREQRWDDVMNVGIELLARYPQAKTRRVLQNMVDEAAMKR